MKKFSFVLVILTACFASAMDIDRSLFEQIISDFEKGNYTNAIQKAINLEKNSDSNVKNDSRFFLIKFFDCMAVSDTGLEQFRKELSGFSDADKDRLGYYSDYDSMMAVFNNLAVEKYESTGNIYWLGNEEISENNSYSEGIIEFQLPVREGSDSEEIEEEDNGTPLAMKEIINAARSHNW
jgi:hypothetical protein